MNIGELTATLGIDTTGVDQARSKMMKFEKDLEDIGKNMSQIGRRMSLFITTPLVAAGVHSFKMAADVTEAINKVDVAFKKDAEEIKKWSEGSLKAYGMAKLTALDMVALFGDMATSMGINTMKAAEMSKNLVGLAGDLASFKNIRVEVAQTALSAIFTGETESLKRLGIVMTEVNLTEYALSQGITKRIKDMNQMEKVQLRYNYILEVTKNSHGDFERTSESAANQMRMFRESIKEVSASFGETLIPVITPMIQKLNSFLERIKELSDEKKKWIVRIVAITAAIGPLLIIIGNLLRIIPLLVRAFRVLKLAMLSTPITAAIFGITSLIAILVSLRKKTQEATKAQKELNAAVEAAKDYGDVFGDITATMSIVRELSREQIAAVKDRIDQQIKLEESFTTRLKTERVKILQEDTYLKDYQLRLAETTNAKMIEYIKGLVAQREYYLTKDLDKEIEINQKRIDSYKEYLDAINSTLNQKNTFVPGKLSPAAPIASVNTKEQSERMEKMTTQLGSIRGIAEVMANYNKQLAFTVALEEALGVTFDENAAKIQLTQQTIEQLIDLGMSPMSSTIEYLKNQLADLGASTKATFTDAMTEVSSIVQSLGSALSNLFTAYDQLLSVQKNNQLNAIKEYAEATGKTEEWLTKKQDQVNREYARKRQNIAIAQAVINGAQAITSILSTGGGTYYADFGVMAGILSGIVAATVAAQIATIKAQGFSAGGIVPPGYPGDTYPALLTSGETVTPPGALPDFQGGMTEQKFEQLFREQSETIVDAIMNQPLPITEGMSIKGVQQGMNRTYYKQKYVKHVGRS